MANVIEQIDFKLKDQIEALQRQNNFFKKMANQPIYNTSLSTSSNIYDPNNINIPTAGLVNTVQNSTGSCYNGINDHSTDTFQYFKDIEEYI